MTKEFEETVNRLARARNFEDGSYLLIAQNGDEVGTVEIKGDIIEIVKGILTALKCQIFPNATDNEAWRICRGLKGLIADDEMRRFLNGVSNTSPYNFEEMRNVSPFQEGAGE